MQNNNNLNENHYHKQIINLCDRYPHDEEMMVLKAKSLKYLEKRYKLLECLEEILRTNPNNLQALCEIANYLK